MAKLRWYQIRRRGQFMLNGGNEIRATSPIEAMRNNMGGGFTTCIVIELNCKTKKDRWWLITKENCLAHYLVTIGKENIHPCSPDPLNRLAVVKACEEQFREGKIPNPNLELSYLNNQLKEYREQCIEIRIQHEKTTIRKTAQCQKECALAENSIVAQKTTEANAAIVLAETLCKEAKISAEKTHIPGATKPNASEKAVANAQKQFDKTNEKLKRFTKTASQGLEATAMREFLG